MPKVSVIMPLYNSEKYIKSTIESILCQTFEDFELLLINDCPIDNTLKVVNEIRDKRIKLINNVQNKGISFSRNVGLDASKGEYIALMDDDDLASKDRFIKEVSFLDTHDDIDVVGGRYCIIDGNNNIIRLMDEPLRNPEYIKASLMLYDPIGNGSVMFRKDFIEKNRIRYQDNCLGMEDYRFWIDCSLYGRITNLNDLFLYWRDRTGNETERIIKSLKKQRKEKFAEIQKYAIIQNGYFLEVEEISLLQKMFPEGKFSDIATREEIDKLYNAFQKIIGQAESRNVKNLEEVKIFCRKQFSRRLEYSEVWF